MSIKKQFDQIKAAQKRQEELQKRRETEEIERQKRVAAEKAAKENAFFEEHKLRLMQVILEIGIVQHLQEVKRDFWKLGRLTQSEFLTLPQAKTTAFCDITLEAKWDALNETDPKKPYIFEEYRSLVVRITAY